MNQNIYHNNSITIQKNIISDYFSTQYSDYAFLVDYILRTEILNLLSNLLNNFKII